MGETTPLATTERHFSGARLTRAPEWLGNLGNAVAPQDYAASLFQAPRFYRWGNNSLILLDPMPKVRSLSSVVYFRFWIYSTNKFGVYPAPEATRTELFQF